MTQRTKTVCLAALCAALTSTAIAAPAQAAPDWSKPADLSDPAHARNVPRLGYADGGLEVAAHVEFGTGQGAAGKVVVTTRRAGEDPKTEGNFEPTDGNTPALPDLDVAPNGAAVLMWMEFDVNDGLGRYAYRAAYRSPDGRWEQPVTVGSDEKLNIFAFPEIDAAIGADGTAVAGATHAEAGPDSEFQPDNRSDVRIHRPGASSWDAAARLSEADHSSEELKVAVDDSGIVTTAYNERTSEGTAKGPSDDQSTVKTRRWSATGGWTAARDIGNSGAAHRSTDLQLGVAPDGRAIIVNKFTIADFHFTVESRRSSATGEFSSSVGATSSIRDRPLAAGVAPDGTSYILVANDEGGKFIEAIRAPANGAFSNPKQLGGQDGFPEAALGFRGNDAFFVWTAPLNGARRPFASFWASGAVAPEARRPLDPESSGGRVQVVPDREGSVVAVWENTPPRYAAFDATPPRLVSVDVPASGRAGEPIATQASFADLFSPLGGEPVWDFGDGTGATGANATHAYAQPGDYTVTVTGADALGNERRRTFPVSIAPGEAQQQQPQEQPQQQQQAPEPPPAIADRIAPTLKLKLPAKKLRAKRSAWQTLRGTVADAQPSSGIKRVEVTAFRRGDKRKVRTAKLTGANWKLKLPKLTRGAWTFRVRVVDKAGNASKVVQQKARLR